jgi:hypothetical protein
MVVPFRLIAFGCAIALAMLAVRPVAADEFVSGHFKGNGTFVEPYMRSSRDGIFSNNYSTKGNVNPWNGKPGTRVTPPNHSPSYFTAPSYSAPSYANVPSHYVAPSYSPAYVPPVDDSEAREAKRWAAEAARAAQIAAAARQFSEAKAQALATAKQNSEQRRKAFSAELDSERSTAAADIETRKAKLVADYGQSEPAAVESDKAELRTRYRELIELFNQEQIAEDNRFKADIERQRQQLQAASDASEARAVAIFGRAKDGGTQLSPAEISEYLRRYDAIQRRIAEHNTSAWPDQTKSAARATAIVNAELNSRVATRLKQRDQQLSAIRAAREQELSQRIAKLESEFERAEAERFAADQERAERRFLAYVHGGSIDSALKAEPVAYNYPATSSQSTNGAAVTVAVVAGLGLLLALGAVLSARSKPTDFRPSPPDKR